MADDATAEVAGSSLETADHAVDSVIEGTEEGAVTSKLQDSQDKETPEVMDTTEGVTSNNTAPEDVDDSPKIEVTVKSLNDTKVVRVNPAAAISEVRN